MHAQGYWSALLLSIQPTERLAPKIDPLWVNFPLRAKPLAEFEPVGNSEGIWAILNIAAKRSEPGANPDVDRTWPVRGKVANRSHSIYQLANQFPGSSIGGSESATQSYFVAAKSQNWLNSSSRISKQCCGWGYASWCTSSTKVWRAFSIVGARLAYCLTCLGTNASLSPTRS